MTTLADGAHLGPYEILFRLGVGGMGEVWKGRDTRLDRFVAIKCVTGPHGDRFAVEARAIAALNHPNICQIYDVGPDYLVLEFVEGRELSGPLPVGEVVRLGIQIAAALEAAHRRGILHRDLKPGNILLTGDVDSRRDPPSVKLLDFGIAKMLQASAEVTRTGIITGTPAYMSPEQAHGAALDARSDVFSFGAVLYEMLTGTRAFGGDSAAEVMSAVLRDDPAPLGAPTELREVVMRCLRKTPADRFQTIADVKEALERLAATTTAATALTEPSIAVLPFANLSADKENEYFSDGLAEELINVLAQIPGLKVTARTSAFAFRGKEQDIRRIAEVLRVRTILEGSVRRAGARVRVSAQLIDAANGYQLWSDRYDREMTDAFAIQDEIAQAIASTLRRHLAPSSPLQSRYVPTPAAYEAYLKSRYHRAQLRVDSASRGLELASQAIALDPKFALARQLRSSYFLFQALMGVKPAHDLMPQARSAALEALACDASLPEGHALLGVVAGLYDFDWVEQARRFALALARDPVSPDVRANYGTFCLYVTGRAHEGSKELKRALEADPLNMLYRVQLAMCLDASGDMRSAESELLQVLELNENFFPAAEWLAVYYAFRGRLDEARPYAERAVALLGHHRRFVGLLAGIVQRAGDGDRGAALLETLGDGSAYGAPIEHMVYCLLQSDTRAAAAWCERAIEQRDPYLPVLLTSVAGKGLRSTPYWSRLVTLMHLAEAGHQGS